MLSKNKHSVLFILFQVLFICGVSAQVTNPVDPVGLTEDTLEVIESDSTITYIIEVEPVTIRDTVKVVKPRKKHKFYYSISGSMLYVNEIMKAKPSYEYYLALVDSSTTTGFGYSLYNGLWMCPKKIFVGLSAEFRSLKQIFEFVDIDDRLVLFDNRFKYLSYQFDIGYWFRKKEKVSVIPYVGFCGDFLLSHTGYTVSSNDFSQIARINMEMEYKKLIPLFSLNAKTILTFNKVYLEVEPYIVYSPLVSTKSTTVYTVKRNFAGVRLGFQTRLFN